MMKRLPGKPLRSALLCGLTLALAGGGCSFGPKALERTHGRYNEAVRLVEEEQLLRNLVHLRYHETPLNLDVSSITAQYELSGQAEARPFFLAPNPGSSPTVFRTFLSVLPDALVSGANRPTVALTPADESTAVRQFLTPITLETLIFLTQTSWPASTVARLWVERINGVPNAVTASGPARDLPADFARFLRIAALLQECQDRELASVRREEIIKPVGGALPPEAVTATAMVEAAKGGLEYRPDAGGKTWVLVRRETRLFLEISPGAEASPEVMELLALLNLVPGLQRYDVSLAARGSPDPARFPVPPSTEVRIVPRSTAQVYFYLANGVEVPDKHLSCGLVGPAAGGAGQELTRGLFEVHVSGSHKSPPTAYVAIKYRGYWFYIDDRDQATKDTFALVLHVSRLDFARQRLGAGPVLTLPAGR
jgi:hypothetical protein